MPTVMITGANRGLGLEFARQYAADGWSVIATCRDPSSAKELKTAGKSVEVLALDVADFKAIAKLGETLKGRAIDVLINNAGVIGTDRNLGQLTGERWMETLRVDTVAPLLVAQALLPNLRAGADKKAVFITSRMGSITDNGSGRYYDYRSAKAGLNAAVVSLALDTKSDGLIALAIHPGWVKTDLGGSQATLEAADSVVGMRRVIAKLTAKDSGRFLDFNGKDIPW